MRSRPPPLTDADVRLLTRVEAGETTFRTSSAMQAGDSLEQLVCRLIARRLGRDEGGVPVFERVLDPAHFEFRGGAGGR